VGRAPFIPHPYHPHRWAQERFLRAEEFRALLADAPPREHVILRIFAVCGLRSAEVLVLRIEDFEGSQLRIDEALTAFRILTVCPLLQNFKPLRSRLAHLGRTEYDNLAGISSDAGFQN
jgi:integrase